MKKHIFSVFMTALVIVFLIALAGAITAAADTAIETSASGEETATSEEAVCEINRAIVETVLDKRIVAIDESFFVTFSVDKTRYAIEGFSYVVEGFALEISPQQTSDQISFTLQADGTDSAPVFELQLALSGGDIVKPKVYGVVNEYGVFLSAASYDDAWGRYLAYMEESGAISEAEAEKRRIEYASAGVQTEIYTSENGVPLTRAAANTWVSGYLRWQDDNGVLHPLQYTAVTVMDKDDIGGDDVLGEDYTDENGWYTVGFENQTAFENGGCDPYLIVHGKGADSRLSMIDANKNEYTATSTLVENVGSATVTTINMTFSMGNDLGRAFQILQAAVTMVRYIDVVDDTNTDLGLVRIQYPGNRSSSCYVESERCIHILAVAALLGKPESYASWDVVAHEYGHHVQSIFGVEENPGGGHYINRSMIEHYAGNVHNGCNCIQPGAALAKNKGIRLAWAEAWNTVLGIRSQQYFSSILQNIDTVGDESYTSYNGVDYNLETGTQYVYQGEGCESTVIYALYDLCDPANEMHDAVSMDDHYFFKVAVESKAITFSEYINYCINNNKINKIALGNILSNFKIAPYNFRVGGAVSSTSPTFYWSPGNDTTAGNFYNNQFEVVFFDAVGNEIFRSAKLSGTSYKPTQSEWDAVLDADPETVRAGVYGYQTAQPVTGPYLSNVIEYTTEGIVRYHTTDIGQNEIRIDGIKYKNTDVFDIPSHINGRMVTQIGASAFHSQSCTKVVLPESITIVGSGAFENCTSLTSAALGKTQQIGDNAFRYCSALASVTSTASVQSIGSNAFEYCSALKKISLNGVQHIGSGAFKNCSTLQTVESLYIVQDIGDYAFSGCIALAEVTLPASLTSIAEGAFRACSGLETVHCKSSPAIGTGAFADCLNLSDVYFDDEEAPALQSDAFLNDSFTVYVPYCSRDAYAAVFAGCDAVVDSVKVTLTLMDGNTVLETQEVYYKSTVSLPEPEKNDYLFWGWFADPSGAGTDLGFSIYWTSYEDQTFYAQWLYNSKYHYMNKIKSVADYYVLDAYESLYSTGFSVAELAEYYSEQDALLAGTALYNAMLPYADLQNYDRPEVIVSGNVGSSVQDEMQIIEENLHSFDRIVVTGTSACTFLAAYGHSIGLGYVEESLIPYAQELMERADEIGIDLILPEYVVTLTADQTAVAGVRPADDIPANEFPAMVPLPWYQDQVGQPGTLRVYGYPLLCPDDMLNESILGTVGENIRQFILHNEALGRSGARLAFLGDWQSQGTPEKYFYYSGDWRLPFGYPLWENLCGSSIGNVQTLADVEFQPGDVVAVRVEFILPARSSKLYQQQFEKNINAILGTVKHLAERGCKVILLANNPVEVGNLSDLQDKNFNDPSFLKQCSQYFGCDVGYMPIDDLQDSAASSAQVIWTDNLALYEM